MDRGRRVVVRALTVAVGLAAGLGGTPVAHPTPYAAAGRDPAGGVIRSSPDDTVSWLRATELPGWQNQPQDRGPWSFRTWSFAQYPLNCGAQSGVAYQFIWAQRAGDAHASLLATRRPAVRAAVRRASSVFAASWAHVIDSAPAKLADHTPRVVTEPGPDGLCQVAYDRVQVPIDVWRREPYENYDNDGDPATPRRQGLFPWLEALGYDRPDRRYVVIEQGPGGWNPGGGAAVIAADGTFQRLDDQPGPQNRNEAAGTWIAVNVRQDGANLDPAAGGSLGEVLAHEWAHSLGAMLPSAPHYNPLNPVGHASDCADLLCYNDYDADGQHYDACGGATADTFAAFGTDPDDPKWGLNAPEWSRAAYRLDCHRDDYWGVDAGTGAEKRWVDRRWSIHRSRWLWGNPDVYTGPDLDISAYDVPPECAYDPGGWCPDGTPGGLRG
ncbi:hypothetical protein [Nocardioides panaciterrulae]|uniref:Uncharacterized protein n=1 Tax=Nocardioides panaciterrulae TaxID=661492 RepID=A0A7Y9JBY3_9ACTN|nr:hypothetical protein [Nocardioides panaciterrulae]NYD42848.1 hypothetical protein [Nocardioides panaciterrulae]